MSNVFQLFQEKKIEGATDHASRIAIAVAEIMASNGQLAGAVKELSKHLDALDSVIEVFEETSAKERLMHVSKVSRESLTHAVCELSQQLRKLPNLRNEFIEYLAL